MNIEFQVTPKCKVSADNLDVLKAFEFVAYTQEVLGVTKCGQCGSPHVVLQHRSPKGYNYYSVKCEECGYELKFGQTQHTNRLFPKGWEAGYQGGVNQDGPAQSQEQEPEPEPEPVKAGGDPF